MPSNTWVYRRPHPPRQQPPWIGTAPGPGGPPRKRTLPIQLWRFVEAELDHITTSNARRRPPGPDPEVQTGTIRRIIARLDQAPPWEALTRRQKTPFGEETPPQVGTIRRFKLPTPEPDYFPGAYKRAKTPSDFVPPPPEVGTIRRIRNQTPEPIHFHGRIQRTRTLSTTIERLQKRRATSWDYQRQWRWIPKQPLKTGKNTTDFYPFHDIHLWLGYPSQINLRLTNQNTAYLTLAKDNAIAVWLAYPATEQLRMQNNNIIELSMTAI